MPQPGLPTAELTPSNSTGSPASSTITGLNIPDGATFWIRWTDADIAGADDGLSVVDFSLTPFGPTAALPVLTVKGVTRQYSFVWKPRSDGRAPAVV
jgi:hypothetical protein